MTPTAPQVTLELALPAEDITALRHHLAAATDGTPGTSFGRARAITLEWHDDEAGSLAARGLAVVQWRQGRASGWRAEPLDPALPPGASPPAWAEAENAAALQGVALPAGLRPVQRWSGRLRAGLAAGVSLRLAEGRFTDGKAAARLTLAGPVAEVTALAVSLARAFRLDVPLQGLAGEALAQAGLAVPARRLGAPDLPRGLGPGAAFAHAAGHLLGVLLHHAPAAAAGQTGEPVHQMRVALRRMRALASVFDAAVACAEMDALRPELKALAGALGPARDWDVFLGGTGQQVLAAFPEEGEVASLMQAASAQREVAYAALGVLLAGPELRCLAIRVAAVALGRPWEGPAGTPRPALDEFGAIVLSKRLKRVTRKTGSFETQPEAELHVLRLRAKRLRYAAEVFAPLFPGRDTQRFLRRLAALQEALGHLNDGAVAAGLMRLLADQGGAGLAGGMVRGFVAGRAGGTRQEIARAWKRLRKATPFWL